MVCPLSASSKSRQHGCRRRACGTEAWQKTRRLTNIRLMNSEAEISSPACLLILTSETVDCGTCFRITKSWLMVAVFDGNLAEIGT